MLLVLLSRQKQHISLRRKRGVHCSLVSCTHRFKNFLVQLRCRYERHQYPDHYFLSSSGCSTGARILKQAERAWLLGLLLENLLEKEIPGSYFAFLESFAGSVVAGASKAAHEVPLWQAWSSAA